MKIAQPPDCFRRDQWGVTRQNDNVVVAGQRLLRDHESVAGAALFGLEQELDAGMLERGPDSFRFVPNNGVHIFCRHHMRGSGDGMGQKWLASDFM